MQDVCIIKYANCFLAVDIRSLFISGEVKYEGLTLYKFDGNVDLCNTNGLDCPYPAGGKLIFSLSFYITMLLFGTTKTLTVSR